MLISHSRILELLNHLTLLLDHRVNIDKLFSLYDDFILDFNIHVLKLFKKVLIKVFHNISYLRIWTKNRKGRNLKSLFVEREWTILWKQWGRWFSWSIFSKVMHSKTVKKSLNKLEREKRKLRKSYESWKFFLGVSKQQWLW